MLLLSFPFSSSSSPSSSSSSFLFLQNPSIKPVRCFCQKFHTPRADEGDDPQQRVRSLLAERYRDGSSKRYILGANSHLQTVREEHEHLIDVVQENHFSDLSWLPRGIKDFILPKGYPVSVSDDYLDYMLWLLPTNGTGWVCHTLVMSSLLKAVGVGSFTGTSVAASAAAVRWVSKDGLGAVGRLLIGGRFGNLFDDDPKQWRMYADFIGSAGSIFELSTQLYPAYFLPLASLGNLAKAIARGLKDPSFRVIQNHFSISGNLGEVAAKINLKRARLLVRSHVMHQTVPGAVLNHLLLRPSPMGVFYLSYFSGYVDCNKQENILSWEKFAHPQVTYGVSMEKMISMEGSSHTVYFSCAFISSLKSEL